MISAHAQRLKTERDKEDTQEEFLSISLDTSSGDILNLIGQALITTLDTAANLMDVSTFSNISCLENGLLWSAQAL